MMCPRCNVEMDWSRWQGPLGGWKCPDCGLQIDKKGYRMPLMRARWR